MSRRCDVLVRMHKHKWMCHGPRWESAMCLGACAKQNAWRMIHVEKIMTCLCACAEYMNDAWPTLNWCDRWPRCHCECHLCVVNTLALSIWHVVDMMEKFLRKTVHSMPVALLIGLCLVNLRPKMEKWKLQSTCSDAMRFKLQIVRMLVGNETEQEQERGKWNGNRKRTTNQMAETNTENAIWKNGLLAVTTHAVKKNICMSVRLPVRPSVCLPAACMCACLPSICCLFSGPHGDIHTWPAAPLHRGCGNATGCHKRSASSPCLAMCGPAGCGCAAACSTRCRPGGEKRGPPTNSYTNRTYANIKTK